MKGTRNFAVPSGGLFDRVAGKANLAGNTRVTFGKGASVINTDNPWPRDGDILFLDGADWWHNACVGWSREEWDGYAEGYRRAGNLLVQHVSETQANQDYLIYPIVFLYRQAIEVALKHLLFKGTQLLDRGTNIPKNHRLVPLWHQCRKIIEEVWPGGSKEELDAVGEMLLQFDGRDPTSTVFRYPVNTLGQPSLPDNERINIRNFSEVANRVYALLDAGCCGVTDYLQMKAEMEREYF